MILMLWFWLNACLIIWILTEWSGDLRAIRRERRDQENHR
jgi:hypothetical protein